MPRRPDQPPLTHRRIIDAALALSGQHGLDSWTVRQLAAALDSWPRAVEYRVGNREAIVSATLERIVALMPIPPADLAWQDWFRRLLIDGEPVIHRYPGAARRLCRDGPAVPSAVKIIDQGVGRLLAGGFGTDAPRAYAVLLDGAMLSIALDDDRALAGLGRQQAALNLAAVADPPDAGPGWRVMRDYLTELANRDSGGFANRYRYTVELLIAGLESDLRSKLELQPCDLLDPGSEGGT